MFNLLVVVGFNIEFNEDTTVYQNKKEGKLLQKINYVEKIDNISIKDSLGKIKLRIKDKFIWNNIVNKYKEMFVNL